MIIGIGAGLTIAEKYAFAEELKSYHESRKTLDEIEFSGFEVISLNIKYNQIYNFAAQQAITNGIKEYRMNFN